jgi:H+/gluconate symporter-like permease
MKGEKMRDEILLANFFMGISFLATNWISRITLIIIGFMWLYFANKENQLRKKEWELSLKLKEHERKKK